MNITTEILIDNRITVFYKNKSSKIYADNLTIENVLLSVNGEGNIWMRNDNKYLLCSTDSDLLCHYSNIGTTHIVISDIEPKVREAINTNCPLSNKVLDDYIIFNLEEYIGINKTSLIQMIEKKLSKGIIMKNIYKRFTFNNKDYTLFMNDNNVRLMMKCKKIRDIMKMLIYNIENRERIMYNIRSSFLTDKINRYIENLRDVNIDLFNEDETKLINSYSLSNGLSLKDLIRIKNPKNNKELYDIMKMIFC